MASSEVQDLLDHGLIHLFDGRVQEAIVTWMKVLDIDPNQPRALDYLETLEVIEPRRSIIDGDGISGGVRESGDWPSPFDSQPSIDVIAPVEGEGGEMTGGPISSEERVTLLAQVEEERAKDNVGGALDICEEILKRNPGDLETEELARTLKEDLVGFYLEQLKPLDQIPQLVADDSNILELSLDPIGGFLLSQVDGRITVEELLTIMGTFDQYRVVSALHYFLSHNILELTPFDES